MNPLRCYRGYIAFVLWLLVPCIFTYPLNEARAEDLENALAVDVAKENLTLAARADPPSLICVAPYETCSGLLQHDSSQLILQPRTLIPHPPDMDIFLVNMFAEGNENIVRVFNSETGATSSAEYRDLTTQAVPLDMGLEGLCGCTILVVVSQEAVYFAHFFEDMAFIKGDRRNAPEPDFQGQVLSFLESGLPRLEPGTKRRKKNGERYDSLKQHADSFKTGVKAFILTPQNETKDAPGDEVIYVPGQLYEEQINQLKMKVLEILPDAGIIEYMYQAVNAKTAEGMKALDKTAKGKALYQFDPEQRKDLQKVWENWRLFFEGETEKRVVRGRVYDETWKTPAPRRGPDPPMDLEPPNGPPALLACGPTSSTRTILGGINATHTPGPTNSTIMPGRNSTSSTTKTIPNPTNSTTTSGRKLTSSMTKITNSPTTKITTSPTTKATTSSTTITTSGGTTRTPSPTNSTVTSGRNPTSSAAPGSTSMLSTPATTSPAPQSSSTTALPTPSISSFPFPSSQFPLPPITTTVVTSSGPNGPVVTTVTGTTDSRGTVVPVVTLQSPAAANSAKSLASRIQSLSDIVKTFSDAPSDQTKGNSALASVKASREDASHFGRGLGFSVAGLCFLFCRTVSLAASLLGELEVAITGVIAGSLGIAGLTLILSSLTAVAASLNNEAANGGSTSKDTSKPSSTTSTGTSKTTSTTSCRKQRTVTDCAVRCSTGSLSGTGSTSCFSTSCRVTTVSGCSATATTTTTFEGRACPLSRPPSGPITLFSYPGFVEEPIGVDYGTNYPPGLGPGTSTNPTRPSSTISTSLLSTISASPSPTAVCTQPLSCELNGCAGAITQGGATCKGASAGCPCIPSVSTPGFCGPLGPCSFVGCQGINVPGKQFGECQAPAQKGCSCIQDAAPSPQPPTSPPPSPRPPPCEDDCTAMLTDKINGLPDQICTGDSGNDWIDSSNPDNGWVDWWRLGSHNNCFLVLAKQSHNKGFPDEFCFPKSFIQSWINNNALGCNAGDDFFRPSPPTMYSRLSGFGMVCLSNFKNYQLCGSSTKNGRANFGPS